MEIYLSSMPNKILRIFRTNVGNTIYFHSSSSSWFTSPIRLRERSLGVSVTALWLVVVNDTLSCGVRRAVFSIFSTRSLVEDWKVRKVLMYLNQPILASRWVDNLLNLKNACYW